MRARLLTALVLGLVTFAGTPGVSGADHSVGEGPRQDMATGTAIRTAVLPSGSETRVMMSVNARSGSAGEDASGTFWVKRTTEPPVEGRPDLDFTGRVTCLRVVGNRAIVGGVITSDRLDLPSNPLEGKGFVGVYVDNDRLSGGAHDESNSTPGVAVPGAVCPTSLPSAPFQQGNYVVHDETP
jgi:hypothetical protein